jgi:hypothetical protein
MSGCFPNLDDASLHPFTGIDMIAQRADQTLSQKTIHAYRTFVAFPIEQRDSHAKDEQSVVIRFGLG